MVAGHGAESQAPPARRGRRRRPCREPPRLTEQPLDIERVLGVGADGPGAPSGGQDPIDERLDAGLVGEVGQRQRVAGAGQHHGDAWPSAWQPPVRIATRPPGGGISGSGSTRRSVGSPRGLAPLGLPGRIPGHLPFRPDGRPASAGVPWPGQRAGRAGPAARERARWARRRPRPAAARPASARPRSCAYAGPPGGRLPGGPDRRRRGRDGVPLRRAAPAVRADAGGARRAARAPGERAAHRVRPGPGRHARPLPGRARDARPAVGVREQAAAPVPRGRCAEARPRVGQVLGLVARRLLADSVAVVFAVRGDGDERDLAGLPELALAGLALPRVGDVPGRVEAQYRRRVAAVPEATRRLLLLGGRRPRRRRDARVAGGPGARDPAGGRRAGADRGPAEIDAHVRFRHPLVRSAVYGRRVRRGAPCGPRRAGRLYRRRDRPRPALLAPAPRRRGTGRRRSRGRSWPAPTARSGAAGPRPRRHSSTAP